MHGPYPPSWPAWQPPCAMNGSAYDLARSLGEMTAESRRHTEILLAVQDRIIDLPESIAERMRPEPAPAPASTRNLGTLREWLAAATAVAALTAALLGKLPWSKALELVGKAGGH